MKSTLPFLILGASLFSTAAQAEPTAAAKTLVDASLAAEMKTLPQDDGGGFVRLKVYRDGATLVVVTQVPPGKVPRTSDFDAARPKAAALRCADPVVRALMEQGFASSSVYVDTGGRRIAGLTVTLADCK